MDRGNKTYVGTGETTEWEDILIKRGIIAPKTKAPVEEEESSDDEDPREQATMEELDEMEDDYDEDQALARIREKRIAEMKAMAARNLYGDVQPISKDEWTREVTEASKNCWVVAYLFESSVEGCKLMDQLLRAVAAKHRDVKFVSIQSQVCIENWPARNLPTLFCYKNGNLATQMLTLSKLNGLDTRVEDLEEFLAEAGVFRF
ncbi:phosducin-like protein [Achlya hypogyna]|uniref:Phosducin-like protein n=1 Tax=Achlya hypogyna TaxID=1202772 RepID=A0A1V9YAI7_ACHHY|nr:phosducin-like protein [Achlya hypogyna]